MKTFASLFTGGGLADVGAMQAGYTLLWGVEYDPAIAAVANANLPHIEQVYPESVTSIDWAKMTRPDHLHMSPPCQDFSVAKTSGKVGNDNDALAESCIEALRVLEPSTVTLENVEGYRKAKGFQRIVDHLWGAGYWVNVDVLNSADFGGEILCPIHASFAGRNYHPEIAPDIVKSAAMMQPVDQGHHLAWDVVASWVRAIQQDTAASATWQKLSNSAQLSGQKGMTTLDGKVVDLLMSVATSRSGSTGNIEESIESSLSKFLEESSSRGRWCTTSTETKRITVQTILKSLGATLTTCESTTQKTGQRECPLCRNSAVPQTRRRLILRAVKGGFPGPLPEPVKWQGWYEAIEDLIPELPETQFAAWQLERLPDGLKGNLIVHANDMRSMPTRHGADPMFTVLAGGNATHAPSIYPRAYLVESKNANQQYGDGVRESHQPHTTVITDHKPSHQPKVFLLGNGTYSTTLDDGLPAQTITSNSNQTGVRASTPSGRVVRMTPRCLARFQSVPDWYVLPEKTALACKIIGNGVPCLMMQRVMEGF